MRAPSEAPVSDNAPAGPATAPVVDTSASGAVTSPGTSRNLDRHVDVRVTGAEHEALARRARALGVKPSAYVRAIVRDALDDRRSEVAAIEAAASTPRPHPELARAVEQVRRVGVLLNQTKRDGKVVDAEQLADVLDALNGVRAALGDGVSL